MIGEYRKVLENLIGFHLHPQNLKKKKRQFMVLLRQKKCYRGTKLGQQMCYPGNKPRTVKLLSKRRGTKLRQQKCYPDKRSVGKWFSINKRCIWTNQDFQ